MGLVRQGLELYESVNKNLNQQIRVSGLLEEIEG